MYTTIPETFRNQTVFVTGSTGFLGKILTEKLLRSCGIKKLAVLVRSKRGITTDQRVKDMFKENVFDRLKIENPDFINIIKIIDGNIEDSSMGLSLIDRRWIIENVNMVFHCAATIKFNEPLEVATKINIQGTKYLLKIATEMQNLKGFVHVSTAYSHCPRNEIKEEYYDVPVTVADLKNIDESIVKTQQNWPNTYTFTKAITENLISKNEYKLPISIFRPSIIGSTNSEPNPGWLENLNGPSGIVTGVMVGFLRTLPINKDKIADIIPVDYTVNALISVMWHTANRHQICAEIKEKPKIYNYVSSAESPLSWGRFIGDIQYPYHVAPPMQGLWYPFYVSYINLRFGNILRFFLHWIPAVFMDMLLYVCGKKPKMLKMYKKTENMLDLLYEFTTRQWKFDNTNIRELWSLLSDDDRKTFWFSLEEFDWSSYIYSYYYGIRKYLLHEDMSNITKALSKNRKLFWLHHLSIILIFCVLFQICRIFIRYFFFI